MDLSGQIAIVTGAGRGLGLAYACALADAGARVVVTARSENELVDTVHTIEQRNGSAIAIPADATDHSAVQTLVASVKQKLGRIDLLVNNAGRFRAVGPIANVEPNEWWREIEVNLRGPFNFTHAVLPDMLAHRAGRIINVASGAGLQPFETISAYNVSKTALIRLTESTAIESEAYGIAVFAMNPGTVRTPMTAYLESAPEVAQRAPRLQEYFKLQYAENLVSPIEDSVKLLLQLASGQADALTGCFLSVDEDIAALSQQAEVVRLEGRRKLRMQL